MPAWIPSSQYAPHLVEPKLESHFNTYAVHHSQNDHQTMSNHELEVNYYGQSFQQVLFASGSEAGMSSYSEAVNYAANGEISARQMQRSI